MNDYESYISKVHDLPPQENTQPQGNPDFELEPTAPLNEDQLKKDPDFIANSWTWFNATKESDQSSLSPYSSLKYHGVTNDEQVAEWAIGQASAFNNNMSSMGVDFMKMRKRPVGELKAMLGVLDAYSQTETTAKQVVRGTAQMALDPLSWGGFSAVGKSLVKNSGSNSVRRYMRSILAQKMQNPVVTGAAIGATYAGATGAVDEDLRSTVQQRSYNPLVPMIYAGVGAGLGGALGATPFVVKGIYQKFKGWRGGDDGATLTDSKTVAESFGDVQEKTIEAQNPVFFGETTTIDEIADHLDLDEAQTAQLVQSIGAESREQLDTATLMQESSVQEALKYRTVDAVGYPEKSTITESPEIESPDISLDQNGVYMTIREVAQ